jgi:hypothetical protein
MKILIYQKEGDYKAASKMRRVSPVRGMRSMAAISGGGL